jgi:hypothetical protein
VIWLTDAYDKVWKMKRWTMLQKLRCWTVILLMWQHMLRPSEVCQFCPFYDNIMLPDSAEDFDPDGFPRWIVINYTKWKGLRKVSYKMHVIRNYLDQRFDPVHHLLMWLSLSNIDSGPIFCAMNKTGTELNKGTNMLYSSLTGMLERVFNKTNVVGGSPYTIRKSAVKWAARCGAREFEIRNVSRHSGGANFMRYIEDGASQSSRYRNGSDEDPIRKLWVFHPCTWSETLNLPNR